MARLLFKALLLPPLSLFVLGFVGLLLRRRFPRLGRFVFWTAALLLVMLSVPVVGSALLATLEDDPPITSTTLDPKAQAIVVLSAEMDDYAPEYGGETVGRNTLQRVRYAARLHRMTGLPLCTSGGKIRPDSDALATLMARTLEEELQVPVRWQETWSLTTTQNARFTAEVLAKDGVRRVYLVTHGWHLPRARRAFEKAGLEVIPAPTVLHDLSELHVSDFLPSSRALESSALAIHEWIGRVWYAIAYE
ncbi:MAG: YdcF family protein [Planctomycetota bacterium]